MRECVQHTSLECSRCIHLNANFPHGEQKAVFSCKSVDEAPGKTLYLDPVWIATLPLPLGLEGPQCKASEMGR